MKIRRASPEDALAIARVHVRSWQGAYRGLVDDDSLDALRPGDRAGIYEYGSAAEGETETIVSVADGEIVGFSAFGSSRDAADGWQRDGATRKEQPYGPLVEVRRFRRRLGD